MKAEQINESMKTLDLKKQIKVIARITAYLFPYMIKGNLF